MEKIEWLIFIGGLLIAAIYDLRYRIIPNKLIAIMLVVKAVSYIAGNVEAKSLLGGIAATVLVFIFYKVCHGGFGAGDGKLLIVVGFYIGIEKLWNCMIVTFGSMLLVYLVLLGFKKIKMQEGIPMAPFLALGAICFVF